MLNLETVKVLHSLQRTDISLELRKLILRFIELFSCPSHNREGVLLCDCPFSKNLFVFCVSLPIGFLVLIGFVFVDLVYKYYKMDLTCWVFSVRTFFFSFFFLNFFKPLA